MKTSCNVIKDLLPLYHDNISSADSNEMIKDHLEECESCRRELTGFDVNIPVEEPVQNDVIVIKKLSNSIKKGKKKAWLKGASITTAIIVALLLVFTQWFSFVSVQGPSMYPTLSNNELCLVNRFSYLSAKPARGDIVLVNVQVSEFSSWAIKRVVGLPGETIEVSNGVLYINGKVSNMFPGQKVLPHDLEGKMITLPENAYFVMGDNQTHSIDSRVDMFGSISIDHINGKFLMALKSGKSE